MNELAEKIIQTTKAAWVHNKDIKPVFICGACDRPRLAAGKSLRMVDGVRVYVCNKCSGI